MLKTAIAITISDIELYYFSTRANSDIGYVRPE
jgi:hypothetical protein